MVGLRTILLSLCSVFLLKGTVVALACSPSEPPILVEPTLGSLEDALCGLDPLQNCTVQLYLLSGEHVFSSGVAVSAASVALSSHPNNTGRPVVRCGDNMSYPGDIVNETEDVGFLTFWRGARDVNIFGVDFEGCPRTLQFIEVDRVNISDCTFRLADQCTRVLCVYTHILLSWCHLWILLYSCGTTPQLRRNGGRGRRNVYTYMYTYTISALTSVLSTSEFSKYIIIYHARVLAKGIKQLCSYNSLPLFG